MTQKKAHKNRLSNSTIKSINSSKYGKVTRIAFPKDAKEDYVVRQDGWRKK